MLALSIIIFISKIIFPAGVKREAIQSGFTTQKNLFCQKFTKNFILVTCKMDVQII
jgi:hypothetical protein